MNSKSKNTMCLHTAVNARSPCHLPSEKDGTTCQDLTL